MSIEVRDLIFRLVQNHQTVDHRPENWVIRISQVYKDLNILNPSICEDGDTGKIAFGPDDKRMKLRTARFLTRKLHLNSEFLDDARIRKIQIGIDEALFGDMVQTFIVTGPDITKNYYSGVGGNSCMTGSASMCTKLYEDNPDIYSQLIMRRGNDSARAMVVKLDNDRYMLDRIYANAEDLVEKMTAYAKEQNWVCGYAGKNLDGSNLSNAEKHELIVTGLKFIDGEVPYQDTLRYGRIRGGCLDLMAGQNHDYDFEVSSTEGYVGGGGRACNGCGGLIPEDEGWFTTIDGRVFCEDCFSESYFQCESCGGIAPIGDEICIQDLDTYICPGCRDDADVEYCEECGNYFSRDGTRFVESAERTVCGGCLNAYYRECTNCNKFFRVGECFEFAISDVVCRECQSLELPFGGGAAK